MAAAPSTNRILAASAVQTAGTVTSTALAMPGVPNAVVFLLDVTNAATLATDTLDVSIQTRLDGTAWFDIVAFTQVLGDGADTLTHVAKICMPETQAMFLDAALAAGSVRHMVGNDVRVSSVVVEGGVGPASFTFSVSMVVL